MYTTTPPSYSKEEELWTFFISTCNLLYTAPDSSPFDSLRYTPACCWGYISPSAFFFLDTNGDHQSFFYSRSDRDTSISICGRTEKENGREELELQPRSRPFDPSPLCLYTTPDGLPHHHHPGKRRRRRRTNVSANAHNRHYMACLHLCIETSARRPARPSPTLPRFQSAIWLSMMRWLEREMIACEAIRETGTNGLVYTLVV